jgi:hypothetical protein
MSAATSFYTTFQQLMLTLGICTAAGSLAASLLVTGHTQPLLGDYSVAFLVVATISLLASPACSMLPRDAGHVLSGHAVTTAGAAIAAAKTEAADVGSIIR